MISLWIYDRILNNDRSQEISYNQFIHDFLLGDHVQSITVSERGRVWITIKEDFQGEDGRSYLSLRNETPQHYVLHIPEIVPFMTEVETIQLEQGRLIMNWFMLIIRHR